MKDNRYDPIEGSDFYQGLVFKCNELGEESNPLNYSIALTNEGEVAMFQGVMGVQGGGAGNIFLPICPSGTTDKEFFVEETTPITSVVVYIPYAEEETRPDCNTPTMVAVPGSVISKSTSQCPSNISTGGVIGVFQEKYLTSKSLLSTIKTVYDNTANGGDTQYLLDLIANSNVSSFDLRNELLLSSPDVTDRVLIEAIERNPEMNPWHLAQVLLTNSPLPQNVINVLSRSDVQDYYLELVLNGQNGGMTNTTIMEMEQGHFSAEMEASRMDYVRLAFYGDSTFTWNDSIIYYLSDDAGHQHMKTLLSYHIMRGQYQEAQNILNESETYEWSQDYSDVMGVILEAFQDTAGADGVVERNLLLLEAIANDDNSDAHLAQALLESFDLVSYDYEIVLPGMQPKSLMQSRNNKSGKSSFATLHPNPAKNNVYLSWNLPEGMKPDKVTLTIYNIQGKQMLSNILNQQVGIQEITINQWPTGIYLYQLQHDGIKFHSDKFEVLK